MGFRAARRSLLGLCGICAVSGWGGCGGLEEAESLDEALTLVGGQSYVRTLPPLRMQFGTASNLFQMPKSNVYQLMDQRNSLIELLHHSGDQIRSPHIFSVVDRAFVKRQAAPDRAESSGVTLRFIVPRALRRGPGSPQVNSVRLLNSKGVPVGNGPSQFVTSAPCDEHGDGGMCHHELGYGTGKLLWHPRPHHPCNNICLNYTVWSTPNRFKTCTNCYEVKIPDGKYTIEAKLSNGGRAISELQVGEPKGDGHLVKKNSL